MSNPAPEELTEPTRLARRRMFNTAAERYAASRPTYPAALFDWLGDYGGLGPGARVLEIAPGTGQATLPIAQRGWAVTAVELGADLTAVARRTLAPFPNAQVITSAFEDWTLPAEPFDAVVCATAFHWLDPATRLPKTTQALRPGGTVAAVWTHHVTGGTTEFFTRAQDCYRRWDPDTATNHQLPTNLDAPSFTGEFTNSPLVTDVQSARFGAELTYRTKAYLELLQTYSATMALPADRRVGLLNCLGGLIDGSFHGQITKRYLFELVLARRTDTAAKATP